MLGKKWCWTLVGVGVMSLGSAVRAEIIMDATTNNGSFTGAANGGWALGAPEQPTGWSGTPLVGNLGYTQNEAVQNHFSFTAFNNTGVLVAEDRLYSISGMVNTFSTMTVKLQVVATENSDGSGTAVVLAETLTAGTGSSADLTFISIPTLIDTGIVTGAATDNSVDGYYAQVRLVSGQEDTGYYWVDDIVVTSEAAPIPEPRSLSLVTVASGLAFYRRRRAS